MQTGWQPVDEPADDATRRRRRWLDLAVVALFVALTWRHATVAEDAFITFRYARNLAEGAGFVFNRGMPPVEGYSDFLWVLAVTPFEALHLPTRYLVHLLTVPCAVAVLWVARGTMRRSLGVA